MISLNTVFTEKCHQECLHTILRLRLSCIRIVRVSEQSNSNALAMMTKEHEMNHSSLGKFEVGGKKTKKKTTSCISVRKFGSCKQS